MRGEDAFVALLRCAVDFFEDQLANLHPFFQTNEKGAEVPDLQPNACPWILRVVGDAKAGMNRRGCDVDADAQARQAAAA